MLRSKVSIALSGLIFKVLPTSLACRVIRTFRLSMSVSPVLLAYFVSDIALWTMKGLEKDIAGFHMDIEGFDTEKVRAATWETLAALYCLAVAVLAHNADGIWSLDKPLFQWHTSRTFGFLQEWLENAGETLAFVQLVDECTELYLHDHPTLAEFGKTMGDYMFDAAELQPALGKNNWNVTFGLKAKTRILWRLGVSTKHLVYVPLSLSLGHRLLFALKMLQQFRPAFEEKSAEREGG